MLKLKYLFENYELAKAALAHWDFDEDTLDDMLAQFRISSNAIYPFYKDGEVRFLRLAPTCEKLESNVRGELEFIEYLRMRDYNAMEIVPADTGESLLRLNTQWGEYYASVFRRVNGTRIDRTDFSDEIMFAYGKALGKLHVLSAEYEPKTKRWSYIDALDFIDAALKEYSAPEDAIKEAAMVREALLKLNASSNNFGLVHYDFEPDNVFYDKAANECSAIDFDDAMYHFYAMDIDQALDETYSELDGDEEKFERARREFIRGYSSERDYTPEMAATLPLMRRFANIYGYARIFRSVAEKTESEPDWLIELRAKLGGALEIKRAMFGK